MNESIGRADSLLRRWQNLEDDALVEMLVTNGFEPAVALRLVAFLPMAYFRVMMQHTGAQLPDAFEEQMPDGSVVTRALSSEPVWIPCLEFARTDAVSGISSQDFFAIAGRSAECDAANQALNAGNKLGDLVFTPCLVDLQTRCG